jgi:hypothetical protein
VIATFYVQLRAKRSSYSGNIISISQAGSTKGKPANLAVDTVAVKLTVDLPPEVFDAFAAEATVIVPAELVQHPIAVTVEDNGEPDYQDGAYR